MSKIDARRAARSSLAGSPEGTQAEPLAGAPLEQLESRRLMDGLPVVIVTVPDRDAAEEGEDPGAFALRRTGSVELPLTVQFDIKGSAQNGVDFLGLATIATIPAGRRQVRLPVIPVDDLDVEGTEFVRLELKPGGGYSLDSASVNRARTISIADNDRLPIVTIVARDRRASEVEESTGRFNIRRTGPTDLSLTVDLQISGTATMGRDYAPIQSRITFAPDQRVASLIVTPYEDDEFEGDESVRVTIQEGVRYSLSDDFTEVTTSVVLEDKPLVSIWVEDPIASSFPDDTGTVVLRRTGRLNRELDVFFRLEGTAREDIEYESLPSLLTFEPGQREMTVEIRGRGVRFSGDKTVVLRLLDSRRYNTDTVYPARTYALLKIVDDGGPVVG